MLSSVAEWAGVALAAVVGTGLVLLAVAATGVWRPRRKARRLAAVAVIMAGHAGRAAAGAAGGRWQRLVNRVPARSWHRAGPQAR